ncbi:MAG: hypothetical protein JSR82_24985 [Verrucomicrobia bacterium]|nr:hypothetical protein [Verrucomicrobiota bacterium]
MSLPFRLLCAALLLAPLCAAEAPAWRKLETVPSKAKQDDIWFHDTDLGWYGNGTGRIYRTRDGGRSWAEVFQKAGTFVRCLAFLDARRGFAGNIGPGYFPNVSDAILLYATEDGGDTWRPVPLEAPGLVGLCAIDVLRVPFINSGERAERVILHAGGRVGGPAGLLRSTDEGRTWTTLSVPKECAMILDVKFLDAEHGLLCSTTSTDIDRTHALILGTDDGGRTWTERYRSTRPGELTWKFSFPTRDVGFATVQSYSQDPKATARFVARTDDGGRTWRELPLVDDAPTREFGIAFVDERLGWVGTSTGGFETRDGGSSWQRIEFGRAVNKIRVIRDARGRALAAVAIGTEVWRIDLQP